MDDQRRIEVGGKIYEVPVGTTDDQIAEFLKTQGAPETPAAPKSAAQTLTDRYLAHEATKTTPVRKAITDSLPAIGGIVGSLAGPLGAAVGGGGGELLRASLSGETPSAARVGMQAVGQAIPSAVGGGMRWLSGKFAPTRVPVFEPSPILNQSGQPSRMIESFRDVPASVPIPRVSMGMSGRPVLSSSGRSAEIPASVGPGVARTGDVMQALLQMLAIKGGSR